ncbi:hypothetical protein, partial [Pseudomonas syringae group genomosp. 7]|uniref:hypothetical protein n=1 Tax=Pseudomonas syringae group genomosp. 7 TaxID=251699 RepID=UPI00376FD4DC
CWCVVLGFDLVWRVCVGCVFGGCVVGGVVGVLGFVGCWVGLWGGVWCCGLGWGWVVFGCFVVLLGCFVGCFCFLLGLFLVGEVFWALVPVLVGVVAEVFLGSDQDGVCGVRV